MNTIPHRTYHANPAELRQLADVLDTLEPDDQFVAVVVPTASDLERVFLT